MRSQKSIEYILSIYTVQKFERNSMNQIQMSSRCMVLLVKVTTYMSLDFIIQVLSEKCGNI
jgi:hypothetical protein